MRAFATCALLGGALAIGLNSEIKNSTAADVLTGPIYWPNKANEPGGECINPGTKLMYNSNYKDFEPCGDKCDDHSQYLFIVNPEPVYSGGKVVAYDG